MSISKILKFTVTGIEKSKFFSKEIVSMKDKSSQLRLWSDLFKILVKELVFRKTASHVTLAVNYLTGILN